MGRGANENNVIALNDAGDGVLNKLYYPDEFVRHKVIDALVICLQVVVLFTDILNLTKVHMR